MGETVANALMTTPLFLVMLAIAVFIIFLTEFRVKHSFSGTVSRFSLPLLNRWAYRSSVGYDYRYRCLCLHVTVWRHRQMLSYLVPV